MAVVFLFYLHYSDDKAGDENLDVTSNNDTAVVVGDDGEHKQRNIAFVNADSLTEKYEYLKVLKRVTEAKQVKLEKAYNAKATKFQEDYLEYQQKGSQGLITADQAKAIEEDLIKRKSDIEIMEQQLDELIQDAQRKNIIAQKNINKFLKKYNLSHKYDMILAYTEAGGTVLLANDTLDISKKVIEGLNMEYQESIKK